MSGRLFWAGRSYRNNRACPVCQRVFSPSLYPCRVAAAVEEEPQPSSAPEQAAPLNATPVPESQQVSEDEAEPLGEPSSEGGGSLVVAAGAGGEMRTQGAQAVGATRGTVPRPELERCGSVALPAAKAGGGPVAISFGGGGAFGRPPHVLLTVATTDQVCRPIAVFAHVPAHRLHTFTAFHRPCTPPFHRLSPPFRLQQYPDVFAASTRSVSPTGCVAAIFRVDSKANRKGAWGQNLVLHWRAIPAAAGGESVLRPPLQSHDAQSLACPLPDSRVTVGPTAHGWRCSIRQCRCCSIRRCRCCSIRQCRCSSIRQCRCCRRGFG